MQSVTNDTFGPLIAYLVPGATVLAGWSAHVPTAAGWFVASPGEPPTVGGLVFLSLAAVAVGMTVSAVRWVLVDRLHARTGLVPPRLDFANLPGRVAEFQLLIEIHYRHYQFYANMLVAVAVAYVGHRLDVGWAAPGLADLGVVLVEPVFFLTSRDTLAKYHTRTAQLLSRPPGPGSDRD
jgi:hypothetical protein